MIKAFQLLKAVNNLSWMSASAKGEGALLATWSKGVVITVLKGVIMTIKGPRRLL
jgi:hypothetical protein